MKINLKIPLTDKDGNPLLLENIQQTVGTVFSKACCVPASLDVLAHMQFELFERIKATLNSDYPFLEVSDSEANFLAALSAVAFANNNMINPFIFGQIKRVITDASRVTVQ